MRLFFGFMFVAVFFATIGKAALSWDGSFYLFDTLYLQQPFIPHLRFISLPITSVTLFVSQYTNNMDILETLFAALYALIPVLMLFIVWLIVRKQRPSLFIWAAISVGLVTLLGQFFYVSEAIISLHVFLPLWFAILVGEHKWTGIIIFIFASLLLITHPFAIGLFIYALCAWFILGFKDHKTDTNFILITLLLIGSTIASTFLMYSVRDPYSDYGLSGQAIINAISLQPPIGLLIIILVLIIGLTIFLQGIVSRSTKNSFIFHSLSVFIIGLLICCGIAYYIWASDISLWWQALDFRFLSVFLVSPIYLLSFLERAIHPLSRPKQKTMKIRSIIVQLIGFIFLLVIATQSLIWSDLRSNYDDLLKDSPSKCLPSSVAPNSFGPTPLVHWSSTVYSLLIQGQQTEYIVQPDEICRDHNFDDGFHITDWKSYNWSANSGWFNFVSLQRTLSSQSYCIFEENSGWYQLEYAGDTKYRWSDGIGTILIFNKEQSQFTLQGGIQSRTVPTLVNVYLDGVFTGSIQIDTSETQMFNLELDLLSDQAIITFESEAEPIVSGEDTRALAFFMSDVMLVSDLDDLSCMIS